MVRRTLGWLPTMVDIVGGNHEFCETKGPLHLAYPNARGWDMISRRTDLAPIMGNNLVRLAYIDEAGIGNPSQEPFLVVAAVLVHGDVQWQPLESYINGLIEHYIPEEKREGFVFHALELFSGGRFFDRETWPKNKRWEILEAIIQIPAHFDLPVSFGFLERATFSDDALRQGHQDKRVIHVASHAMAFGHCEIGIERWMRSTAPNEVAMLIAEDTDLVKATLKEAHSFLRNPKKVAASNFSVSPDLPLTKLIDTIHFASKQDSSPLQIADVCAYIIKRDLMGKTDSKHFYNLLAPQLIWKARV